MKARRAQPDITLQLPMEQSGLAGKPALRAFGKLGLLTVGDLLLTKPRRYEDRRLRGGQPWEEDTLRALRVHIGSVTTRRWRGGRAVVEASAWTEGDDAREISLRWFNMPFLGKYLEGRKGPLCIFGKLKCRSGRWSMDMPQHEHVENDEERGIHIDRIAPIYALSEGITQKVYRGIVWRALTLLPQGMSDWWEGAADLGPWREALQALHFPEFYKEAETARMRLAYDEFLVWQTMLAIRRLSAQSGVSRPVPPSTKLVPELLQSTGLEPTTAQRRVLGEIADDMGRPVPMNRLLQGDVGSGKTLVAVCAMLQCVEAGCAAALMAPTEILAQQHFLNLKKWLKGTHYTIGLMTGTKKTVVGDFLQPDLWVGTHALFQDKVSIPNLGLVVIDEQHKFGVEQRARLRAKGGSPHVLVMTATPIPRTMALTLYGDLDVSVIDELPKGRQPVKTLVRGQADLSKVWKFVRSECEAGRQSFVVYPVIEASETASDLKAVATEADKLSRELHPHKVASLHGRMSPEDKETVMAQFRDGKILVLVSTTVVEVGVDVPNASVMVIENAERFGLAQLHQLRGRIGRGRHKSYCALVTGTANEESLTRLSILEQTSDGFRVAEADLELRGAGDVLGKMQSGAPPFRLGQLSTDLPLISRAQQEARGIVERSPSLSEEGLEELKARVAALAEGLNLKLVDIS